MSSGCLPPATLMISRADPVLRPGPWTDDGLFAESKDGAFGEVLRSFVVGEVPPAVRGVLTSDRAGGLANGSRRRRVHDSLHALCGCGTDDVRRTVHVRFDHEAGVARTRGVHPRDVEHGGATRGRHAE